MTKSKVFLTLLAALCLLFVAGVAADSTVNQVTYNTVQVNGLEVFYREAGPKNAPTLLLLHGFPTSSQMYRNLIPKLADRYHVIAPDYPGFGQSAMPKVGNWTYSFANLAKTVDGFTQQLGLNRYTLYVQDYGAPIGYRLALAHPERVQGLIVQNGNAYDEGLRAFWDPFKVYWKNPSPANGDKLRPFFELDATKWQYTHGTRDAKRINPDAYTLDQARLDRPGNKDIQLALFLDYGTNVTLYPQFQAYFRRFQPPTLIVWGKNDQIFPAEGAEPYKRDLNNLEFHLLDTGHFALEEDGDTIATYIRSFMSHKVVPAR
jgi:pimeloyl-ACP methyl ester carboxylesterase